MRRVGVAAAIVMLLANLTRPAFGDATPTGSPIVVEPERVGIGISYAGASIRVRFEKPAGYEVAVRLMGHPERLELKRLGKRAGLLWMSVGDVSFENVPMVYQVLSTLPLASLGSPALLAQWNLGYDSLIPDSAPGASFRAELVAMKEHSGLFAIRAGEQAGLTATVHSQQAAASGANAALQSAGVASPAQFEGVFDLPARAPAGEYSVDLIGFKDQQAALLGRATLQLEYVGATRALRDLALDHGLAYGIVACVIAIAVGLLTGLLFRPGAEEGH
jgi:hypothetical protein